MDFLREIKFRGKRVDNNEWVYGGIWISEANDYYIISSHWFTGLHEMNGKEVYENDIVKWGHQYNENPLRIAIVKIDPYIKFICLNLKESNGMPTIFKFGNFAYADIFDKDAELLGNVYDNKELLIGIVSSI